MSAKDIQTLNKSVKQLEERREELRKRLPDTRRASTKLDILDHMDLLSIRRAKLEVFRNHLEAALVIVTPPNDADIEATKEWLDTMSTHVAKDMKWSAAKKLVSAAMAAARDLRSNLDGRQTPQNT